MLDLNDFLEPLGFYGSDIDFGYNDGQLATYINAYKHEMPDITEADIVLVGIGEARGSGIYNPRTDGPDAIRRQFYQLHYWHYDIQIADIGNIKDGATIAESYAAVKTVLSELIKLKKT